MSEGPHQLWGGRFDAAPADALRALNNSIGTDLRLWPHDIRLSKAWARALVSAGIYSEADAAAVVAGLDQVADRLAAGVSILPSDEDVHTLIDRLLHDVVGEPASRLHTGRSRNDQVATASRLWVMAALEQLDTAVRRVQAVILAHAESLLAAGTVMPAYTHLQRAQPVLAAHWMLSHCWPLVRDRERLLQARDRASVMPLGSGAIAGTAFPIPRAQVQQALGFASISPNSIDATGDRDFIADALYAIALLGVHLSRLAEDLILFGTSEFGFVRFGDAFSTGSSMMPQKRNPDVFEIARGAPGRLVGDLHGVLIALKGLPSGYNKDLQDDKRALFDACDTMELVLPAVAGALAECRFDAERMRAAVTGGLLATDLADYLVDRGVPFREAHGVVGRLVRESEQRGVPFESLPLEVLMAAHSAIQPDVRAALTVEASLARRTVPGSTGPAAVAEQLREAQLAVDK
ncbi:MAG: argininosuccinate lyase [Gemmatimonadaceae bacterium]|nr:argininosuccinate lyase [Gemmatimonadaceae bacterium]